VTDPVRWAIIGTAGIAGRTFLPSLDYVGGGEARVVAGRDADRTARFARDHGVQHAVSDYQEALADPQVDAVYVPLPNSMHAQWAMAALEAGKAVLCEKPLCSSLEETQRLLAVAAKTGLPMWEAIAFPFRSQTDRLLELISDGAIGEVREIQSSFHFTLRPGDIRLSAQLAGGALADVGCYPIRLARLVFGSEATGVRASQRLTDGGVDAETWGVLDFPGLQSQFRDRIFVSLDVPENFRLNRVPIQVAMVWAIQVFSGSVDGGPNFLFVDHAIRRRR